MKNAVSLFRNKSLLVEAVKTIDEIFEIMDKDSKEKGQAFQDIQGDVYEMLLSKLPVPVKTDNLEHPAILLK